MDITWSNILVNLDAAGKITDVRLNDYGLSLEMESGKPFRVLRAARGHPNFRALVASTVRYAPDHDLEALYWTLVATVKQQPNPDPRPLDSPVLEDHPMLRRCTARCSRFYATLSVRCELLTYESFRVAATNLALRSLEARAAVPRATGGSAAPVR
jgi:hypothetical protein